MGKEIVKGLAKKNKSSVGWFYGFKLHLVINDKGELVAFKLTTGNVDDRKSVSDLVKTLVGMKYHITKESVLDDLGFSKAEANNLKIRASLMRILEKKDKSTALNTNASC